MITARQLRALAACAALCFFAGCQKAPLDEKVTARDDFMFSLWLGKQGSGLIPEDRADLQDAIKHLKLALMTSSPGLSSKQLADLLYAQISGRTVREIISVSLTLQHDRLAAEIAALVDRERRYAEIDPSKLGLDAAEFLEGFKERMAKRRAEIERLEARRVQIVTR